MCVCMCVTVCVARSSIQLHTHTHSHTQTNTHTYICGHAYHLAWGCAGRPCGSCTLVHTHVHAFRSSHSRSLQPTFLQCLWECGGVLTVPVVPAFLSTLMCTHSDLHTHARSNPLFLQCLWECGGVLTVPVVPAFLSTHTCARIQIFTLTLAPTHFFAVPVGVWGRANSPCGSCILVHTRVHAFRSSHSRSLQPTFLQCLWECGGVLAAPVISASVAHKLMAFVAPKIIGGWAFGSLHSLCLCAA